MNFYGHVIDGREAVAEDCEVVVDSVDPWTRRPWARFPLGGAAEAGLAVAAARRAFDTGPWPRMGFAERGAALHRLADLIEAHGAELGLADTRDMGKPLEQSRGADVPRAAANFRFFADHARLATAEVLPMDSGHHCYGRFEAAGVVAAIAPWNFPLMLASWKIAPALAWGNTVVLKPAEGSPVSATLLARLALEAGLPPGVLNVLHGTGPQAGDALVRDPRVDRVTFTGSSATGRSVAAAAASHLAPVSLELGGKGANLVFADADLDQAVDWAVKAAFTNSGQICLAGSRILVQRPFYQRFTERLAAAAAAMTVGNPLTAGTRIGPLASAQHFRKVSAYLAEAARGPATLLTGGTGDGWTVRPSVLTDVPADSPLWREEVFGPVVAVAPFDHEKQAVEAANDTPYGLNAMLFTNDLARAHRVSAELKAGTVWVNCFFVRDLRAPFGGVGESGVGREGGAFSREFFTEPKAVVMRIGAA
ncbi:Betaine-aldehyde dehydrogenase [Kitasatospora sp. MMS16-BH015]|uniref:aldehyde dehydrogenase n=1 Tax=Kitasatospora sp. MMS16-BH015 TaxID=2018025 RepID=UPI000CA3F124|nr:aldehyde dehydrogenase [Kitasatospora sp. MMS16-BH015]AUG76142.1 Betaine-aldehyde dehydrogenase [Kitasatospora sp. MMS16-BH015]